MKIPLSKVIHNTNKEGFINSFADSSLLQKYLKRFPADKEFLKKVADEKNNEEHNSLVENINKLSDLTKRVVNIPVPEHIYLLQSNDDNNKKHNDMLLIYVIITYLENILNALNKDIQKESDKYRYISNLQNNQYELQLLCKLILQSLMELPNMITNQDLANISYKNDVEYMRELDKQKKFEFKDNMSDDERLLYINYEKNGLADKIDSEDFHKRMYTTEEMYSDIQNASNNNPEYTAILGEDDDNDEY